MQTSDTCIVFQQGGPPYFPHPLPILHIKAFSMDQMKHMLRWPKYCSFSFNISPSNEYSGLISFRMDWLDLLAVQGTLKSLLQHHSSKASVLHIRGSKYGPSASASVLPMNIQVWFPLGWTGWISLLSRGLSKVFSNTTVQKHQFFGTHLSLWSDSHIHTWLLEKP